MIIADLLNYLAHHSYFQMNANFLSELSLLGNNRGLMWRIMGSKGWLAGLLLYFLVTSLSHRLLIKSAPGGHALYELVKILYYLCTRSCKNGVQDS